MSTISKDRLLIQKIEIENCGRFNGPNHSIPLSNSPEKNITIIIGESGRGKSTIHDLVYWCLYGRHKKRDENESRGLDYGLINKDALENLRIGESVIGKVTIYLHDQKEEKYVLTRELKAILNRESTKREFNSLNNSRVSAGIDWEQSVKLFYKNENGNKAIEENEKVVNGEIKKYFPQYLADFFLFDGENLIKFRNQTESSQLVKDGIEKISGLPIFDMMIEHTIKTAKAIYDKIGGKSANAAPFTADKIKFEKEKEKLDDEKRMLEYDIKKHQEIYDEIIKKIERNRKGQQLQKEIEDHERAKDAAFKELRKNNEKFKEFLFEKIPKLALRDTFLNSEKIFHKLEQEDKIPPSISRDAIDKILNSNPLTCVCGRSFEQNDEVLGPWKTLNQLRENILANEMAQGITIGRVLISQMIDTTSKKNINIQYDEFIDERRAKTRKIQEEKANIDFLSEEFKKIDYDEDLVDRKNQIKEKLEELTIKKNMVEDKLEDKERDIKENNKNLDFAINKEKRFDAERNKINLAKALVEFAKDLRHKIVDTLLEETEKATSDYFKESAPDKESFDHVHISDTYDITVRDSSNLVAKLSKGQAHVLGLSYVAGIRKITHTNTFLLIDSPLHNISGIPRNEISEVYSKYLSGVQLVLFVTDSEYLHGDPNGASPVRDILKKSGRIWKEYVIKRTSIADGIETREIAEYGN